MLHSLPTAGIAGSGTDLLHPIPPMNLLLWIAVVLFVLWLLGWAMFEVAGLIIHLLLIAAVVVAIWWVVTRFRGGSGPPAA